jgi:hypothetical protein
LRSSPGLAPPDASVTRKFDKRCAHRADGAPGTTGLRFRMSETVGAGERIRTADRPLTRRIRTISGSRRSWPDVAFSWDSRLPRSPHVVGRLPGLAPRLAPCTNTASSGRLQNCSSTASALGTYLADAPAIASSFALAHTARIQVTHVRLTVPSAHQQERHERATTRRNLLPWPRSLAAHLHGG